MSIFSLFLFFSFSYLLILSLILIHSPPFNGSLPVQPPAGPRPRRQQPLPPAHAAQLQPLPRPIPLALVGSLPPRNPILVDVLPHASPTAHRRRPSQPPPPSSIRRPPGPPPSVHHLPPSRRASVFPYATTSSRVGRAFTRGPPPRAIEQKGGSCGREGGEEERRFFSSLAAERLQRVGFTTTSTRELFFFCPFATTPCGTAPGAVAGAVPKRT